MKEKKVRIIANYLPQFHPTNENDEFWGKGFTEWTNVAKAKPFFRGHLQPRLPGELGFYDLRIPDVREAQAELAREHGIEGFCYWHYWMGDGRVLLDRPMKEMIESGKPDFPFCVAWANHTWSGVWCGEDSRILVEQKYPGKQDYIDHFYYLLKAFKDPRYIKVNGKPFFMVFRTEEIPNPKLFVEVFQELASKEGLKGLHIVGGNINTSQAKEIGFDACTYYYHRIVEHKYPKSVKLRKVYKKYYRVRNRPLEYEYKEAMKFFFKEGECPINEYPAIIPNWDTTPRLQERGIVLKNSTPELFKIHVKEGLNLISHKPIEQRILFLKSWNEWAEGNYIEPDSIFGRRYLEVLKELINLK